MELLAILIPLAVLIGLVWAYFSSVSALNGRCMEKFGYRPVTIGKSLLIAIPLLFCILGFALDQREVGANVIVGALFVILAVIVLWIRIFRKTSFLDSVAAIILLFVSGSFFFLLIVLLIARFLESQNKRRY
jgi:hypothetical protein